MGIEAVATFVHEHSVRETTECSLVGGIVGNVEKSLSIDLLEQRWNTLTRWVASDDLRDSFSGASSELAAFQR